MSNMLSFGAFLNGALSGVESGMDLREKYEIYKTRRKTREDEAASRAKIAGEGDPTTPEAGQTVKQDPEGSLVPRSTPTLRDRALNAGPIKPFAGQPQPALPTEAAMLPATPVAAQLGAAGQAPAQQAIPLTSVAALRQGAGGGSAEFLERLRQGAGNAPEFWNRLRRGQGNAYGHVAPDFDPRWRA